MLFVMIVLLIGYMELRNLIVGAWLLKRDKTKAKRLLASPFSIGLHVVSLVGLGCVLYAYLIEPYQLTVNTVVIETEQHKIQNRADFRPALRS